MQRREESMSKLDPDAEQKRLERKRKKLLDRSLLADIFAEIDEDNSGSLSQDEIHKVFGEYFTVDELQDSMNLNKQGEIELKAFLAWWDHTQAKGSGLLDGVLHLLKQKRDEDQALVRLFRSVANARHQTVTLAGLTKLVESMGGMTQIGKDDLALMFREMDQDASGDIDLGPNTSLTLPLPQTLTLH